MPATSSCVETPASNPTTTTSSPVVSAPSTAESISRAFDAGRPARVVVTVEPMRIHAIDMNAG